MTLTLAPPPASTRLNFDSSRAGAKGSFHWPGWFCGALQNHPITWHYNPVTTLTDRVSTAGPGAPTPPGEDDPIPANPLPTGIGNVTTIGKPRPKVVEILRD